MSCVDIVKMVVDRMSQTKMVATDSVVTEWAKSLPDSLNTKLINSLAQSHWYSFYDNAFDKLLTTHWYICSILIAIVAIIFGGKFYYDNRQIGKKIKDSAEELREEMAQSISSAVSDALFMQKVGENKITFLQSLMEWKMSAKDVSACLLLVKNVCERADSIDDDKLLEAYIHYIEKEFDLVYKVINDMTEDDKKTFVKYSVMLKNILDNKVGNLKNVVTFEEFHKYYKDQFHLDEENGEELAQPESAN